jgi:hypothetical protein
MKTASRPTVHLWPVWRYYSIPQVFYSAIWEPGT